MSWIKRFRLWVAGDLLMEEAQARAERAIAHRISKNHTYIAENCKQVNCEHADGSRDVILSSGDQSVTIALPKGLDYMIIGDRPAYDRHTAAFWSGLDMQTSYPHGQYGHLRDQTGMYDGILGGLGRWR